MARAQRGHYLAPPRLPAMGNAGALLKLRRCRMPTLYTMPGTCSLAPNIALAWLDAPVEVRAMNYGDHKNAEYLAINPKAKVPALRFDDGDVLTEAAAILGYLRAAYRDPAGELDERLRRKEAEALAFMTSEVHASYGPHFAPQRFAESSAAQEEVKQAAYRTLGDHYEHLDQVAKSTDGPWYLGARTFADTFLYVLARWIEKTPLRIDDYSQLARHRAHMEADPGVKQALERQNMEPIG